MKSDGIKESVKEWKKNPRSPLPIIIPYHQQEALGLTAEEAKFTTIMATRLGLVLQPNVFDIGFGPIFLAKLSDIFRNL